MKPARCTRIIALLVLAVLAWSPGVLYAGCGAACPFGNPAAAHCCRSHGAAPAMRMASCCDTLRTAAPVEVSRAIAPSPAVAFAPAPPAVLPGTPVTAEPLAELPLSPPPRHAGIGLYTVHAAFLI